METGAHIILDNTSREVCRYEPGQDVAQNDGGPADAGQTFTVIGDQLPFPWQPVKYIDGFADVIIAEQEAVRFMDVLIGK